MAFTHLDAVGAEVADLAERFVHAGHRLYLVGGIVRDLWLDAEPGPALDIDLTTDATPDAIKAVVGPIADDLWLQGERFGTVGARIDGRAFEITTHRAEAYEADTRKPEVRFSTDVEADLSRRDFTINAMAVDVASMGLVDPFSGASDLASRRLRTPLAPEVSFDDDPLRMLRAARFVAGYDLEPDAELVEAMEALAARLDIVSTERVRDELDKLLRVPDPAPGLRLLEQTGLLRRFLPEVTESVIDRHHEALRAVDDAALALLVLLSDERPEVVTERLSALRCSNRRRRDGADTLRAARQVIDADVQTAADHRRWSARFEGVAAQALELVAHVAPDGAAAADAMRTQRGAMAADLADLSAPLSGRDVMTIIDRQQGPEVGEAMDMLRELRLAEGPMDAETAAARLRAWWANRH